MSKPRFASQVDVNNNFSRPVTQHYLPKRRESDFAKPDHMITSNESRNSFKSMPRFTSNDRILEHDGSKPKPGSTNHSTRSLPVSKSSYVTIAAVPIADHSKNSNSFSDSKHFKTYPRSDLRWKPTGKIFKTVRLRWVPTGKILASCTSKVDSEPPHGSNVDISKIHECEQTLDLSAGKSQSVVAKKADISEERRLNKSVQASNLNPRSTTSIEAPIANMIDLESLFGPLFDEYFNGENQVVSKSSVVTTADASDKSQQQPYSTSSTSTLATTVTADGNFDL
ncbi:hypothetical protein Tco_0110000 [Tanacetum coccineum]